jgi:hypothetical protein
MQHVSDLWSLETTVPVSLANNLLTVFSYFYFIVKTGIRSSLPSLSTNEWKGLDCGKWILPGQILSVRCVTIVNPGPHVNFAVHFKVEFKSLQVVGVFFFLFFGIRYIQKSSGVFIRRHCFMEEFHNHLSFLRYRHRHSDFYFKASRGLDVACK